MVLTVMMAERIAEAQAKVDVLDRELMAVDLQRAAICTQKTMYLGLMHALERACKSIEAFDSLQPPRPNENEDHAA